MTMEEENMQTQSTTSVSNENQLENQRYAGFWMRFWAFAIDFAVVSSLSGFITGTIHLYNEGTIIHLGYWTLQGIISSVVFYLYFVLMTKKLGQTLGKMILGIKVVRVDKTSLRWSDLLFREVIVRFIYTTFFVLQFLYFVVAFTKEKQGLHDMVGNTRVVHVE